MRYFVTGGAGFIGSVLVNRLLEKNNQVIVYDDLSGGKLEHIAKHNSNPNFKFIKGSILNFPKLVNSMKKCKFVYHLAANSDISLGEKETKRDFRINTIGTINILDSMIKNNIKKIAFTSSSAVFGLPSMIPTPEEYGPCIPSSFYGASKLACEGFISAYAEIFQLQAWVFRLANITGKPLTHGIIYDFIKKIQKNPNHLEVLGDGNQEKSYITNEMLVDAIQFVIKKTWNKKDNVFLYNIGNNDKIKVSKIAELFIKTNHMKTQLKYTVGKIGWKGDVPLMLLSNKKVRKLGWIPKKTSEECVLEAILDNKLD